MTAKTSDALLSFGKVVALILQAMCVLAGAATLLVLAFVVLLSLGMLSGFVNAGDFELIEASPLSVVSILVMLAASVAALFFFFGKMRAIIKSVGEGDPFIAENARRLNAMAWLLLGVQVLALPVGMLRLYLANLVSGGGDSLNFSVYDLQGPVMIIILFILARIFRIGATMREDLEGTV